MWGCPGLYSPFPPAIPPCLLGPQDSADTVHLPTHAPPPDSLGRTAHADPHSPRLGGSPGGSKQFPGAIPRRKILHSGQEVVLEDEGLHLSQVEGVVRLDEQQVAVGTQGHAGHGELVLAVSPVVEGAGAGEHGY